MAITVGQLLDQVPQAVKLWDKLQAKWAAVQSSLAKFQADIASARADGNDTLLAEIDEAYAVVRAAAMETQIRLNELQSRLVAWRDNQANAVIDAFWRDGQKLLADMQAEVERA